MMPISAMFGKANKPPTINLLSKTFGTSGGSVAATPIPQVGDLLVVLAAGTGVGSITVTDNQGGTYSPVVTCLKTGSNDVMGFWVRDQLVTSNVTHVTTAAMASATGGGLACFSVTNMTAVGVAAMRSNGTQSGQAAGNTPAPVLSNTPLLKNPVMSAVFVGATVTNAQRAGYTEHFDESYTTPSAAWQCQSRDNGETSATITYGGAPGTGIWGSIALELNAP
jgi:hypothetical protein